jgi:membrane-associated protein
LLKRVVGSAPPRMLGGAQHAVTSVCARLGELIVAKTLRPRAGWRVLVERSAAGIGEGTIGRMTTAVESGDEVPRSAARRRAEIACVSGIAVKTVFALALLPLVPSLLGTDPVLLEGLRGSTSAMASGGAFARVGEASLVLAVLAPVPTLLFATPFYWWAGRLWGPKAAGTLGAGHPKAEQWAQRSGAHLERFGGVAVALAPYLPVPSAFIYAAAGWTGMSLRRFMAFDLVGLLSWIGLIVGLGYAVGQPAVQVAKAISHYGLLITIALVAIAVIIAVVRARKLDTGTTTPTQR